MKKLGLCLGLLAAGLLPAVSQVTVELVQAQDQFLPGEAMVTAVRITNRSGQPLRLGTEANWLTFSIQTGNSAVQPIGEVPVKGEFVVESSQIATKRVDLAPYFALGQLGRYLVTASVHIKEWDRDINSPGKSFYIIDGTKLWEQPFGLPAAPGAVSAEPEVRRYILQEANYLKGELRLYLRLTDASGSKTLRVVPLGPMVSVSHPQPMLDRFSNLHVLNQNGAHSYSYNSFDPDGKLLLRQTYEYVRTRPRLRVDDAGTVSVVGGERRITPRDVPTPTNDVDSVESPEPVKPAETPPAK